MSIKRNPAVAAAVALLIGGYVFLGRGSPEPAAADEQSVVELGDEGLFEAVLPEDDGYHRFIVAVPASVADPADPEPSDASLAEPLIEPTGEALPAGSVRVGLNESGLDFSKIAGLEGDVSLWYDSSRRLWARLPDGTDVLLAGDSSSGSTPTAATIEADPVSFDEVLDLLADDGKVVDIRRLDPTTLGITTLYTGAELSDLLALAGTGPVINADEPTTALESDPYFAQQWALENTGQEAGSLEDADIDAPEAWPASSRGTGVVVAVLDSGVDFGHPDLAATRWTNTDEDCSDGIDNDANGYVDDCHGWDFVYNDSSPWDGNNNFHGTHVAGIIAATNDGVGIVGVAPNATIMDVRILDPRGSGYTSGFASGIRYAVDNGARIINMSVGTQPGVSRAAVAVVEDAVRYARDRGVVIVAAAGNSSVNIDATPVWPASYARYHDNVATIASTDQADGLSSFSNYGLESVTLGAPGSRILSATLNGQWTFASGTSMAAPMVAGAVALLHGDGAEVAPVASIDRVVSAGDAIDALSGRITNARRLNVGNLYTNTSIDPVRLDVTGLQAPVAGRDIDARLHIRVNDAEGFATQPFRWEARLLVNVDGIAYGVLDHPITVNGRRDSTDEAAVVALSDQTSLVAEPALVSSGVRIDVRTALPAGVYALTVEAVPIDDPTQVLAPASVIFFTVGESIDLPPETTQPGTETPGTAAPGTTLPGSPPPGTAPGGATPPDTAPTATAPQTTVSPGQEPSNPTTTAPGQPGAGGPTPTTIQSPGGPAPATTLAPGSSTPPPDTAPTDTAPPTTAPPNTAPPNTAPSNTAPPTTAPPNTAPTAPTTTIVQNGQWSLNQIEPSSAPANSRGGIISLSGTFPRVPVVHFGSHAVAPMLATATYLLVPLPTVATPGAVDVSLTSGSATVLVALNAFTFTDGGTTPGAPTTTTASSGPTPVATTQPPSTQPTSTTAQPPSGPAPGGGGDPGAPTTTGPPTTASPSTTTTTTTTPAPTGRRSARRAFAFGEPVQLDNGLRAAAVFEPLWPTGSIATADWGPMSCSTASCRASTITARGA